jgi:uncharacterized membrane protein
MGWIYLEDYNFVASILSAGNVSGAANTAVAVFDIYEDKLRYLQNDGISNLAVSSNTTIFQNRWCHVAVVKDASAITLYIDGEIDNTGTLANNLQYPVDVAIGEFILNGALQADFYYKGKIDELSFWSTPLSTNDIRDNMCKRLTGSETGLLYYYRFDHSSGTILTDLSGNNNHGTLINMENSDWVTSGAALGDISSYDYTGTVASDYIVSLSHSNGDQMTATGGSGTYTGIHLYLVNESPNLTSLPSDSWASLYTDHYWGVFPVGLTNTYSINYNYSGVSYVTDENKASLAGRYDNASTSWNSVNPQIDTESNILSQTSISTFEGISIKEIILGMTSVSYEFSLTQNTLDATILSGETYNYSFTLYNTGMTDSYTLTVTGADPDWSYTLLNALANATIHSLTVNGNSSQIFIVQTQVPLTVSNGEADSITVNAVSQGDSSLSQDIEITTSTPLYSFTSQSQSMTSTTIVAGESCYYTIQIQNAGNYTDTYLITSQGNDYTVSIRNSTDTTTITQITLDASATDTFLVKVDVPLTIANADFDAMTITMISTGRSSLSDSIQLTTSTPFYSFTAQAQSLTSLIDPGESYNYTIDIQNSGNAADTYLLTTQGEMYTTTFRNASDSASITQITINSSATDTFIVKVTVPLTATNGGFDAITLTMTSVGRSSLSDSIQLTTSTPFIAFTAQAQSVTATLNPGESYNYTIQIENTGSATDTYALTTQDAVYDYVFRDASDSTTISQITINPSSTDTIIAKVTLPLTAANGGFDAITVTMTSTERTSVSNSIQLTTSTPLYSFTAQVLSLTETTLDAGESYNYTIQIQNTGTSTDTYLLTTQGAVFSYTFRNASDSATITQITINASGTGTFIAKVTVPLTVADGDVDGVTILMTSVGRSSVSDSLQLTTTVPLYSFTAQSQSSTTIVIVPGASHNYTIQIENTGTFSDTYLLTTQGGLYSYSLRNASDSASITQLTIDQSLTDTFIAKVTVPLTVANADFDSITIHMTSLGKTSVSDSIQLTTATPYYAFTAQAQSLTSMIAPGASYNYTIQLQNTGNITDTYLLTGQGDIYPYTFRNASDSAAITQITINASSTDTFIAKVPMPLTAANGDFDAMTITMTSVGRTSESNSIQLTTSTPFYAFTAQAQSLTSLIDPGESYNYTIQVQNTGNSTDTYILTTQGEQYSSTFRNASDSASITQISINASVTDTFIVKVTVPLTATNGGYDAITITMTSEGRTSISDSIQLTTSTPFFAFTAQAQSVTSTLNPGESYNYTIQIENTGSATDTYALTTQDAVYDYVFRDASDSTTISQITINPSSTDTIIAKVTLPLTAANGGFDAITITMTSTERTSVSNSIQLTTSTPLYSFTAQVLSLTETTLNAGESYNYTIQIQNTGTSTDTYLLTTQGDVYPYTFRNAADSATITQITINASGTDTFIAKVTVPLTVANGDSDAMTIDMTSIVRSTVSNSLDITTSTHLYSFESQTTAYTSMIDAGESYNYTIQIQNTGTTADTYLLTTQGDIYSYTFRNASDSASITQITIQASGTDTFIAKVTVPLTVANGDYDGVTILMTSLGRPSVSDSVQLTTTVPFYSFTAQSQSSITVVIVPGASHNYTIQIENTGTSSDTY